MADALALRGHITVRRLGGAAGPVFHPRICAVTTAASCAAHLWLVVGNQHGAWLNVLMLVLAAVCVPCVGHIWRDSRVAALHQVMGCALVMVAVHGVVLLSSSGARHSHLASASGPGDPSAAAGLLAVIGMEITTALLAATLVARLRRVSAGG